MANTLFKDIDDLRTVLPQFHASGDTADIFPFLEEGAIEYIHPYISEDYYEELRLALVAAAYVIDDLTAAQQAVINHLRRAEAYYGFYVALPTLLADVSSQGFKETSSERTQGARQWVVNDNKKNYIRKADLFIDKVLAVLEAAPGTYTTWAASDAFTIYHKHLLSSADEMVAINGSRRTFMKLRNYIKIAEDRYVTPAISDTLLQALITKKKAGTALNAYETKLVDHLYQAISFYAIYMGAPELMLDISAEGIRVVSTSDGITGITPADRMVYSDWLKRMEGNARHYMAVAKLYLNDNAEQFDDYTSEAQAKNEPTIYANNAITGTTGSVMI